MRIGRDATDTELLGTRYYGCVVDDLYNRVRRHARLKYLSPIDLETQRQTIVIGEPQ